MCSLIQHLNLDGKGILEEKDKHMTSVSFKITITTMELRFKSSSEHSGKFTSVFHCCEEIKSVNFVYLRFFAQRTEFGISQYIYGVY